MLLNITHALDPNGVDDSRSLPISSAQAIFTNYTSEN